MVLALIFVSFVGFAMTSLGYIAFKHPDDYVKLARVITTPICAVFIGALIWDSAVTWTFDALSNDLDGRRAAVAVSAIRGARAMDGQVILMAVAAEAFVLGLLLLRFLSKAEKPG